MNVSLHFSKIKAQECDCRVRKQRLSTFTGNHQTVSVTEAPFCFPTSRIRDSSFPSGSAHAVPSSGYLGRPSRQRSACALGVICIQLMINHVKHLSLCLFHIRSLERGIHSSLVKCVLKSLAQFLIGWLGLFMTVF